LKLLRPSADGGFTLLEMIVALAVMAILLSILVPPLMEYRVGVGERERMANHGAISDAIRQCYALEGRYPPAVGDTGLDYLRDNYGVVIKPDIYEYSYAVEGGMPVLSVEARGK
jgi:prepilin-type N-terminal cleavage/methylation domain-containing protein